MTAWTRDADPAVKRFKNRKKTLRERYQAGRITAQQRAELLDDARTRLRLDRMGAHAGAAVTIWDVGLEHLAIHGTGSLPFPIDIGAVGGCDPTCIGAEGARCHCACGGRNHGAAHWTDRLADGCCRRCGVGIDSGIECSACELRRPVIEEETAA